MNYINSKLFQVQLIIQFLLIGVYYGVELNENIQIIICTILLCTVGIPHGSNDYLYRSNISKKGLIKFVVTYISLMLLYLIIWWIIPIAGLVIFFGISIHHFGQSNFENTKLLYLPSILWGIWVLLFPVLLHSQEAITIFQQMLLSNNFRFQFIQYPITDLFKIITLGIFTFLYFIVLKIFEPQSLFKYFIQFLIVTVWYLLTPLLFGFIIFFCLWHSLQSLKHQSYYFLKLSKANLKEFIIKMIPFSAVALGFFGIYIYYRGFILSEAFILLSILTFPHVLIMDKLYKKSSAFLHTAKN